MKYFILRVPKGEHFFPQIKGDLIHIISKVGNDSEEESRIIYSNSFGMVSNNKVQYYKNEQVFWKTRDKYTKRLTKTELSNILKEHFEDFI